MLDKASVVLNKKKIVYILIISIIIIFFIGYKFLGRHTSIVEEDLPSVAVATAKFGPVVRYINAIGTLRPHDSVVMKSEVNSSILKIHFSEGEHVEKGDLLIELDDTNARAALMEAEAQYRKAKSEFEPTEKLADKGVMARIERDKRKAEMDMCAAKVASSKNYLEKHKIVAPFGGTVGLRDISVGQYVAPGNELVKLVDCHPLKVDFKIPEVDINNIFVGQSVKILVGGDNLKEYDGKISAIDPESDKISHSFDVRAVLDIAEDIALYSRTLKPGIFVTVKVIPDDNQKGILIPESCLEKIGDEYFVYRVIDKMAIRTIVTIGMKKNDAVEIITGLNEGDVVITSGQHNVLDGRGVSIEDAESESLSTLIEQVKATEKKTVAQKSATK